MANIQLYTGDAELNEFIEELDEEDSNKIGGFMAKVHDCREMCNQGKVDRARRFYDSLKIELDSIRDHYSDMGTYTAGGAAAGAAAGAWLFGVGAIAGGLIGGAGGYLIAKGKKDKMMKICDSLHVELGHRP